MATSPPLPTLHALGLTAGTDKAVLHQYTMMYPYVLESLRGTSFNMLEIGTYKSESLRMWSDYFPRAQIYGADKGSHFAKFSEQISQMDQASTSDIQRLARMRNWTVVVDDGSHKPTHQLNTFMHFFSALQPGGVYIIEDVETSFWAWGQPRSKLYTWTMEDESEATNVVERFAQAATSVVNSKYTSMCGARAIVFSPRVDSMVASVQFVRNAIIVVKAPPTYKMSTYYSKRHLMNCTEPRWARDRLAPFPPVSKVLGDLGLYDEAAWFGRGGGATLVDHG